MTGLPNTEKTIVRPNIILESMRELYQHQEIYQETRGIHCSAISDGKKILALAEDIGRLTGRHTLEAHPHHQAAIGDFARLIHQKRPTPIIKQPLGAMTLLQSLEHHAVGFEVIALGFIHRDQQAGGPDRDRENGPEGEYDKKSAHDYSLNV